MAQLEHWWNAVRGLMNIWREFIRMPPIDWHLWTIPYEFRNSMHLYIALIAFAGCRYQYRVCGFLVLGFVHAIWFSHWDLVCFFTGAVLAQMDVLREQKRSYELHGAEACTTQPLLESDASSKTTSTNSAVDLLWYVFTLRVLF